MERLSAEGHFFHRECFRCSVCASTLRLAAYAFDVDEGNPKGPGTALGPGWGSCPARGSGLLNTSWGIWCLQKAVQGAGEPVRLPVVSRGH